jgi:ABC-type branched-subunit amino acid transport system substrate-binding protein
MKRLKLFLILLLTFTLASTPVVSPANAKGEVGISKTEILLGATVPITGPGKRYFQDFFVGARAYFDYLNSKGGIQGRQIRLILKDDQFLPTQVVTQNANLLLQDKVFALFNVITVHAIP